jgi:hypothetical protein
MRIIKLASWVEFESEVSTLLNNIKAKKHESEMYVSDPLFRGHKNASWTLQTTLERYANREYTIADYHRLMLAVGPAIASLTERSWDLGEYDPEHEQRGPPPGYEFMIYVRHHGLPSPLLDGTHSPYVAAFFAFRPNHHSDANEVAIYSYTEYYASGKAYSPNLPTIVGLGPYVVTHRRHYNQQCAYTICRKRSQGRYVYCSHEEAFQNGENEQDLIIKYLLPSTEREKVLEILDRVNINAYSLFGGEDALMETLAYREIERRGRC